MSKRQVPNGDPDLVCPLHKASMDKVCSRCPWWQSLKGRHPQTGEEIDRWDCAIALLPLLLINTANEARQGAAATESFRNEMVRLNGYAPESLPAIEGRRQ